MFEYRVASAQDLEEIWNMNIAKNPDDPRWTKWKAEYISYNRDGMATTFVAVCDGHPVGEGTLLFSPECKAVRGRKGLVNTCTANVNALRIRKEYEGQGHISQLMHMMEAYAVAKGYTCLTIGVDAKETRNLGIYLHWGYNTFVMSEWDEGELVLYYQKSI